MARDFARRDIRIGCGYSLQNPWQLGILTFIVLGFILTLQLDSDGKIITSRTAAKPGLPGVPGALGERHKLNKLAVAANQQVGRYLHASNLTKIGVCVPVELIPEQRFDFGATEFSRWQTNAMQDDRVEHCVGRARIAVGADALSRRRNQTRLTIDCIVASHDF